MLNDIEIFVKIATVGSFSNAARLLGLPKSTVSRRLALMEESLNVVLINRTTRTMSLTAIGQTYYEKCLRVLDQLQDANNLIKGLKSTPSGSLRVTAPYELGLFFLQNSITDFIKKYPHITLQLELANRMVDLVEEGFDIALRIGDLGDSSLTAVKVATLHTGIYASPQFFANRVLPQHPHELDKRECLQFHAMQTKKWIFKREQQTPIELIPAGRLAVNSMYYLCEATQRGLGVAALSKAVAQPHVKEKRLIELFTGYTLESIGLYAIYPHQKFLSPNVRSFIDFIKPRLERKIEMNYED